MQVVADAAVFDAMRAPDFDPFNTVLLPQPAQVGPNRASDSVTVLSDTPGRLSVRASTADAAVLVFSEAYFPGWQVRVDGRAAKLLRADEALLAVALPAGTHTVEFFYLPPLLIASAALSILALVACGLLVFKK